MDKICTFKIINPIVAMKVSLFTFVGQYELKASHNAS